MTLFITGTDTGVGKTVFTIALLWELRRRGVRALAMKPFCSGGRRDVELIQMVQGTTPAVGAVNPFYFKEPLAPYAVARERAGKKLQLGEVVRVIRAMERRAELLIVEGAGGVLSPLGQRFSAGELIARLGCPAVVVARNCLGTINHTRLTVEALRARGVKSIAVVLMGQKLQDASAGSNALVLRELLAPVRVLEFPYLGAKRGVLGWFKKRSKILKKTLAPFGGLDTFCARSSDGGPREKRAGARRTKRLQREKKQC